MAPMAAPKWSGLGILVETGTIVLKRVPCFSFASSCFSTMWENISEQRTAVSEYEFYVLSNYHSVTTDVWSITTSITYRHQVAGFV